MIKVLVFGTFDGVHDGHRAFLKQAREHGEHLIVAVADDDVVRQLKNRSPRYDMHDRIEALFAEGLAHTIVPGDTELGSYQVIRHHQPQVIAVGYDQIELLEDLRENASDFGSHIDIVVLKPHKSDRYHSSLQKKHQ